MSFPGFPTSAEATPIPRLFFSQLLPAIARPEELIVTLYFFYAQGRAKGRPLSIDQLAAETPLISALAHLSDDPQAALRLGLALAVARGTLLQAEVAADGQPRTIYLLNTPNQRRALARLARLPQEEPKPPAQPPAQANIFALYEDNIGPLAPLIADELKDAEERYPWPWLQAAFREAVALNKRSWRYIQAVLQRWEREGPDYEAIGPDTTADGSRKRSLFRRYRYLIRR